ncbi:MAG: PorT family protein, partial [Butyricimonas sp.]|nr:PorT family protein [Butyricimonas sp.]
MALGMWSVVAVAQQDRNKSIRESEKNGWEYEVKAGVNIGGASPIPLPEEIRKVNSFSPK